MAEITTDELLALLYEIKNAGVEFRMLDRYVVVQIDCRTWDTLQEWVPEPRERPLLTR